MLEVNQCRTAGVSGVVLTVVAKRRGGVQILSGSKRREWSVTKSEGPLQLNNTDTIPCRLSVPDMRCHLEWKRYRSDTASDADRWGRIEGPSERDIMCPHWPTSVISVSRQGYAFRSRSIASVTSLYRPPLISATVAGLQSHLSVSTAEATRTCKLGGVGVVVSALTVGPENAMLSSPQKERCLLGAAGARVDVRVLGLCTSS